METAFDLDFGTSTLVTTWGRSLRGKERVNEVYGFDVVFVADDPDDNLEVAVLERPVSIRLRESQRSFHGIVERIELVASLTQGRRSYSMRVVPRLQMLKRRRNSRIFQEMSILEIVQKLLDEHGVPTRSRIASEYPNRSYCVQYRETDFAFIRRLLAQEGIFFYFDHPAVLGGDDNVTSMGTSEVLVLSDTASYYTVIEGDPILVSASSREMHSLESELYDVAITRRVRSTSALVRGYDHNAPMTELRDARLALLTREPIAESCVARETDNLSQPELNDAVAPQYALRHIYEYQGSFEEQPPQPTPAIVRIEQERADVLGLSAWGTCARLFIGRRFTLHEHFVGEANQEYVVTALDHEAAAKDLLREGLPSYRNRLECIRATTRARPKAPKPRVRQVIETAIVVAPEGSEMLTDHLGRVRVRFHWDLASVKDEHRTCWLRTMQPWAGDGWGAQFIPRAGMEVLVSFLGGDIDKPVVLGALYNATHPPPFGLPDSMTKSGIRTRSTPDGEGFNELLFDDARGGELVSIRAQRNFVTNVLNDHRVDVGSNQLQNISGDRKTKISGADELVVQGAQKTIVRGVCSTTVEGGGSSSVGGNRVSSVAGSDTTRIEGGQTLIIQDYQRVVIGGGKDGSDASFTVNGDYRIGAAQQIELRAKQGVRIVCGESVLELRPDEIRLTANKVTLRAREGLSCTSPGNRLDMNDHLELKSDEIKLFSRNGSLVMDDDAKLDAKQVKLNCDPSRPKPDAVADDSAERGMITFRLDPQIVVEPGARFTMVIATPAGELIEKEADADHQVQIEGVKGERYTLVDVRKDGKSLAKKASPA